MTLLNKIPVGYTLTTIMDNKPFKHLISTTTTTLFLLITITTLQNPTPATAATPAMVKAAYWFPESEFPATSIKSSLFTHLFCAFADLNANTFRATISSTKVAAFSSFTQTVQRGNPNVKTLLSIGGGNASASTFAAMASQSSRRKAFIDSSIATARSTGFHGLDLDWESPGTPAEMTNFGSLLTEWRAAVNADARRRNMPVLLLTAAVHRSYDYYSVAHPVREMSDSLDWINVMAYDFYAPDRPPASTNAPAGLYPSAPGKVNADKGIVDWLRSGFPAGKIVFGLPFYGYSWKLVDPSRNGLSDPANGAALSPPTGAVAFDEIRKFAGQSSTRCVYDSAVVTHYCYMGTTWIGFDDVTSVSTKVRYAKGKRLLGYFAWHVGADTNNVLSSAALRAWGA